MLRITLPLVLPGVLGAAIFVFAEMLGSFSAALVLGLPSRFYVVTTAIYQLVSQYPPRFPLAAAMGVSLFAVMFVMVYVYRRIIRGRQLRHHHRQGVPAARHGRRPAALAAARDLRRLSRDRGGPARAHPALRLVPAARHGVPAAGNFTLANYATALSLDAVRSALGNSLLLGFATASIGVRADGLALVDDLPLPAARARRDRVHR